MNDDTLHIYQEEKPWGNFRRFTLNTPSTVKILTLKPNEEFSLQNHGHRLEFWRVIMGNGSAIVGEETKDIVRGDELTVPAHTKHRIQAGSEGIEILEISLGLFDESDIVRYEDKYGRVEHN